MTQAPVIEVLGSVRVVGRDRVEVDAGGRSARTVLAMLAVNESVPLSTDALIDAVWGDEAPANAAASLRNHISRVRRALFDATGVASPIAHSNLGYQLDSSVLPTDAGIAIAEVNRCRQLATTRPRDAGDALLEVLSLWRGDPLGQTTDPAVLTPDREALAELRLAAAELRFDLLVQEGRSAECLPELEAELHRNPEREHIAETLMRALYATGRQRDALLVYQRTREHLLTELGLEPGPALVALEHAILSHDVQGGRLQVAPVASPSIGRVGLAEQHVSALVASRCIGREEIIGELERIVLERREGPAVSLVIGDAGIGKTVVGLELLRRLEQSGASVVYASHDRDEHPLPLQPWADLVITVQRQRPGEIERALSPAGLAALRQIAPGLPAKDGPSRGTSAHAVRAALTELLEVLGRDHPACVLIDDAHWADPASLDMLRHLWRNPPAGRTSLIATARGEELEGRLADLADDLAVSGRAHWLAGLDASVGADLALAVNTSLGRDAAARVVDLSGGNPLLIEHIARSTTNAAFVAELIDVHPDRRASRLLRERLGDLDERARTVLGAAATVGIAFDVATVVDLSRMSEPDVLAALRLARQRRVVVEDPADPERFQFAHALFRSHLRDGLLAAERVRWHGDLARQLADRPEHSIEAAYHAFEALPQLDADFAGAVGLAAAEEIRRRGASAALFDIADRFVSTPDLSPSIERRLLVHRARARTLLGEWEAARRDYLDVYAAAAADLDVRAQVAIEIDDHGRTVIDFGPRVDLLTDVHVDQGGIDGIADEQSVRVAAALVTEANQFGRARSKADTDALEVMADRALLAARVLESPAALAAAMFARKATIEWRGDDVSAAERRELAEGVLALATELADVNLHHNALLSLIRVELQQGDLQAARQHLAAHRELADRTNAPRVVWFSRLAEATFARLNADMERASALLDEMHAYGTEMQVPDNDSGWASGTFLRLYHSKDRAAFAAMRPLAESFAEKAAHQVPWVLAAALTQVADGDLTAAAATWNTLAPELAMLPRNEFWSAVLCFSAELAASVGAPYGDLDLVYELLEPWNGKFVVVGSMVATLGPADRYLAMLDDARGFHDRADDYRARARQLARRLGALQWLATMSRD